MSASAWLRQIHDRLFGPPPAPRWQRRRRKPASAVRGVSPRLEALEDRLTPTVFTPTVFTDGVTGGTLREAILNANNDPGTATDTIQLAAGTYTLSIPNAGSLHEVQSMQGDLNVTSTKHALVIQGATDADGHPTTSIRQTAVDRVFQVLNLGGGPAASVTFQDLIIEGGNAQDDGSLNAVAGKSYADGGGILSFGGNVALDNVVVQNNQALGGPLYSASGGGISVQDSSLAINNSVIRNNTATGGDGGGTSFGGNAFGGGVFLSTTGNTGTQLSITNSTVAGNIAQGGIASGSQIGGSADGGGIYSSVHTTLITGSTLSGNQASGGRGGRDIDAGIGSGGGAFLVGSTTVVNSTIALNSATGEPTTGGGVTFSGNGVTVRLTNVTVAGNQANRFSPVGSAQGGGLFNVLVKEITLVNTLVAGNAINSGDNSSGPDLSGLFISGGHNLIGIAEGVNAPGFTGPGDRTGTAASPLDPKLGPLQNNGGPTQTMLPLPGSPALGAGDPARALITDQRGLGRPPGGPADIGAAQVTGVGSPPPSPAPAMPALHTPFLLAFFDQFLNAIKTLNADGTVTVTDSFSGLTILVSTYNNAGDLMRVTFLGFDVTLLFA